MWKFTREDTQYGPAFFIESFDRKIAISDYQITGYIHKTIITLSPDQFTSFREFYCKHQDVIFSLDAYTHAFSNCGNHYTRTLRSLSTTTMKHLKEHGILHPADKEYEHYAPRTADITVNGAAYGWVYLMADPAVFNLPDQTIKIGFSTEPRYRERTLQAEKPTIELITAWKGSYEDESSLHQQFKHKRLRGEWFKLNENDICAIHSYFDGREVWQ